MKKILCPTDFSEAAQNGVAYAAKTAQVVEAQLVLFNVQSVAEAEFETITRGTAETFDAYEKEMESMSYRIARTFRISCYSKIQPSSSSVASTIASFADDYDLVVMGTNGPDDIYQFLMGSNAYRACVKTNTPALLIPEKCNYYEIKNVVYAFDYLKDRRLPLSQLKRWIKIWGADLSVLQVLEEAYSQEVEDEVRELQYIAQTLHADDIQLSFDTIRSYEIAQSIHSYMLRNKPDLLALCTVHRNLLERLFHNSLIRNISGTASYPVLIFHE